MVLASFPYTDLSARKPRPALVLADQRADDVVLAFVTSGAAGHDARAECVFDPSDPEFTPTGLKMRSVVTLTRIATLHQSLVLRRLGRIGPQSQVAVDAALRYVFKL
jgi:mRNA interferase MazF